MIASHLRPILLAIVALALSAGLAFAGQPPEGWGLTNAADHAGKTVPVAADQDEDTDADEDTDTDETDEDVDTEDAEDAGDQCTTDPTGLSDEDLEDLGLNHGAVVCWAAHQETFPEEFENRGAWVRSWAIKDKDTEDPEAGATTTHGKSAGKGKGH